jgi:hypothetical protein
MPKTADELGTRALNVLGVLANGQPVPAEDLAKATGLIPALIAQLQAEDVIYIVSEDDIPDEVFLPLARRLALEVAGEFGLTAASDDAIWSANEALRRLRGRPIVRNLQTDPVMRQGNSLWRRW